MKNKVTYFMRCEYCGEKTEYIARMKNVNNTLTDKDIRKLISIHSELPQKVDYCEACKMETLQTRVAWKGTIKQLIESSEGDK